ncbi:hypothetical protein [Paenibacillus xylanexedens]|uniref:hypothetical protein n=1 Tax=Paenibacillus xylanexedens TaxID=528191 RepID=UPI0011A1A8D6|nr:hypothetical protein [Paenibacillus xylanexedens]
MYIIQAQNDISSLMDNFSTSTALIVYVNHYLQHLQSELPSDSDDIVTSDQHNPIILLEPSDDLHNLSYAGLES